MNGWMGGFWMEWNPIEWDGIMAVTGLKEWMSNSKKQMNYINHVKFKKLKHPIKRARKTPHVKPSDCYETKVMTWDGGSR